MKHIEYPSIILSRLNNNLHYDIWDNVEENVSAELIDAAWFVIKNSLMIELDINILNTLDNSFRFDENMQIYEPIK